MSTIGKRTSLLAVTAFLSVLFLLPEVAKAQGAAPPAPTAAITGIQFTYKRDPRVVDGFRGVGPWATGPSFGGATAQDTVEVRAEGMDAAGKPVKISPEWIPSDPEMVTVSPSQGDDVKITVHKAGESKLTISYEGFLMELVVKAEYLGNLIRFEIAPPPAPKPNEPAVIQAPPAPKSKSEVSYAVGMSVARALEEQSVEVDVDSLIQGVKDGVSGAKTRMTEQQALAALQGLYTDQRIVEEGQNRKAVGEKNKREGEAFLAENRTKEGVVTLPSGLQYKIIKAGQGKKPTADDVVNVQYRGTFIDGREFDNSYKRNKAVSFPVRAVIKGWTEALQLMPEGSKWQLFVPSDLAYGERGAGGHGGKRAGGPQPQTVGPNATLIFEVELLSVQEPGAKPPASSSTAEKNLTLEQIEAQKKVIEAQTKAEKKPETNP